jgi:sec-independent protein translocase protein TatC
MAAGLLSPELEENINKYYPFLMEIRKRLIFLACVFLVFGIIGFFYYGTFVTVILKLLNVTGVNFVFTSPFQFIELAVDSGFIVGLAVIFPLIIFQVLSFLKPALKAKEYRLVVTLIPLSLILFAGGFLFGFSIMKYVITLFYQKSVELNIGNYLDVTFLLSKIILTGILMGLAFQFPVAMTILMRLKLVKYRSFTKQRFIAWSAAIIFAALLPPTDILSLVLLTLPLVLLFEFTLILNRFVLKTT